ncbi:PP2C family protein-serine/threonine phosphatase [Streptomyces demainii]|uniref:Serine/threonine protein phosphatase PrpC n=1 Tax=Streptomyces demainii TaxID=588122 RepID=A0ABT9L6W9_9ACTN|nr:PP2C family serine/threonine-protein phosphatase [Streptomyces demainii]MDP9616458.1 serine/threonine protein phosphatase PrpC [Streptomyces demainii]
MSMPPAVLRFAARSNVGAVRSHNEDSAYAGSRLLAVADGMGGHACGEVASVAVIDCVAELDHREPGPDPLAAVQSAVTRANARLRAMIEQDAGRQGMGTTLTAMLWDGVGSLALVHVGDSRAYVLRDDQLRQLTRDHTFVQSLIDAGRISQEEAAAHPHRSMVMRAVHGMSDVEPDLSLWEGRLRDRYLLCSDGLTAVVADDTLREVLASVSDPDEAARRLISLANQGGGPDNITCVVADILPADPARTAPSSPPQIVGAAHEVTVGGHAPAGTAPLGVFGPTLLPDDHGGAAVGTAGRGNLRLMLCFLALLVGSVGLLGWCWLRAE